MSLCSDMLETDPLQFGFKDKIGTTDALFTMKSTIKHFINIIIIIIIINEFHRDASLTKSSGPLKFLRQFQAIKRRKNCP